MEILTPEMIMWVKIIFVTGFDIEFLKIEFGRFYSYKDISGVKIIKDRKTNKEYMKFDKDSNLIELDKNKL